MNYKDTAECTRATQSERNCSTFETAARGFEAGIGAVIPNTTAQHSALNLQRLCLNCVISCFEESSGHMFSRNIGLSKE